MIRIANLEFSYPDGDFQLVIDRLSIGRGTSTAIIGPSGAGKSTLLDLMAGVAIPSGGSVITNGVALASLDDNTRRDFRIRTIGFVFQQFELLEYLNVFDNILLPYRASHTLTLDNTVRARTRALADMLGIADKLHRLPASLSQGERQRAAICRALVTQPPLILADEPTGNLDPVNTDRILDILFDYVGQSGTTLVGVTHERHFLDRFDHVVDFADFHQQKASIHA